jgi:hypothetical protein
MYYSRAPCEDTQPIQRIGTLRDFVAGLLAGKKKNVCAAAIQAARNSDWKIAGPVLCLVERTAPHYAG